MKRTPLKRKTPLSPMSAKRRRVQRQRRELVKTELEKRELCEAGITIHQYRVHAYGHEYAARLSRTSYPCSGISVDLHEPLTRARGGSILDPKNTVAVCRSCHDWVHDHPEAAESLGLLRSK